MKILVTGGAGFIGSHVVEALEAQGDDVLVIDDLSSGRREWVMDKNLVVADIGSAAAEEEIVRFAPEAAVLLAAQPNVKTSMRDPVLDAQVNVIGLLRVMESAARVGCSAFVLASSGGTIYGDVEDARQPILESHAFAPRSFYGVSKAASAMYLDVYAEQRGVRCVSLALGNVYGPRQNPLGESGVAAIFTHSLLTGRSCVVNGDGQTRRDFVHVRDVTAAFVAATRRGQGLVNVGSGCGTTVLEIFDELAAQLGSDRTSATFGPALAGEVRSVRLDPTRAQRELGWMATIGLREGLQETITWQREDL